MVVNIKKTAYCNMLKCTVLHLVNWTGPKSSGGFLFDFPTISSIISVNSSPNQPPLSTTVSYNLEKWKVVRGTKDSQTQQMNNILHSPFLSQCVSDLQCFNLYWENKFYGLNYCCFFLFREFFSHIWNWDCVLFGCPIDIWM